jgi:SAM-dependent methyltransferase
MSRCIEKYLSKDRHYEIVDLGARVGVKQTLSHRDLFDGYRCTFVGTDVAPGRGVDVVMKTPYRLPFRTESVDLVISGQAFEHIPFPWASIVEVARILRRGGLAFLVAPSRGHVHTAWDGWRYYPDALRALAAFSRLRVKEARTDFPPTRPNGRFDYHAIHGHDHYWGDSVGVLHKPLRYPERKMRIPREILLRWANRVGAERPS